MIQCAIIHDMTVRQTYIDTFKTYLRMRGEEVWFNDSHYPHYPGSQYPDSLAKSISKVLIELGFITYYLGTIDYNRMHKYIYFNCDCNKKIFLITNNERNVSWYIEGSNKPHNNTTMICYLMRRIFPELKKKGISTLSWIV